MIMPFGKHKGKEISSLPKDYLQWLINAETKTEIHMEVCRALGIPWDYFAELKKKIATLQDKITTLQDTVFTLELKNEMMKVDAERKPPQGLTRSQVDTAFRHFALRWHPDRGGSDDKMRAANDIFDYLRDMVK